MKLAMVNWAIISLGSNLEKESNMPAAARLLGQLSRLVAVSAVYETEPVGLEDQPAFWNAAALVETELEATVFRQEVLARVEQALGRVRQADKNAPRTIDADLTLFNDWVFDLDDSHPIPDPALLKFAHVCVPVAELKPALAHPVTGEKLADIAARLIQASEIEGRKRPPLKRPDIDLTRI